jgi:FAD/FMN-containing dehydrogenase
MTVQAAIDVAAAQPLAGRYDIAAFRAAIGDVPTIDDPVTLKRRARDYYWFSPIVKRALDGKTCDLVVEPRDEADVVRVAAAAARLRIPITMRGTGTGTYGQGVPLEGGIVLDTSRLTGLLWMNERAFRARAGQRMHDIDVEARKLGRELRMHPSTKRIATIGGFFCGGSGGVGSIRHGGLREPGNLLGCRVVTLEEFPKLIELRGLDCNLVNRTYGTTGIVVEVEMPLAETKRWRDIVVTFDAFEPALAFGHALAADPQITKKLCAVHDDKSAAFLAEPLAGAWRPGEHVSLLMVDEGDLSRVAAHAAEHGGRVARNEDSLALEADPKAVPIFECAWGHTTLHGVKTRPGLTYLQALFAPGRVVEDALTMFRKLRSAQALHVEFLLYDGELGANGYPRLVYESDAQIADWIAAYAAEGVSVANPHVWTVEDGSRHKRVPGDQLAFKTVVDPHGLLNPGKMTSYRPVVP